MTFNNFLQIFQRTAKKLNINTEIEASHVCEICRRIIKKDFPQLWNDCTVKSYKDQQINLGANNSNCAQELFYAKRQILRKVQNKFPKLKIQDIKVQIELHKKELPNLS